MSGCCIEILFALLAGTQYCLLSVDRQMYTQLDDTVWSWTCRIATAVRQLKSNDEDEIWVKLSQCHLRDSKAKQVGSQGHAQPHSKQPCTTSTSS